MVGLLRRRRRVREPELVFAVPAWRLGLKVGGTTLEYCVDAYFVTMVSTAYRRILLVYPPTMCRPVPSPQAYTVTGTGVEAEDLLNMIVEGCVVAEEVASRPRVRGPLRTLLLGLHPEDVATAEAYNAWELCVTVFGDREDGYRLASMYSKARAYIEYPVGVIEDVGWRRIRSLARLEPRVAEEVERIVREAKPMYSG